jgi:prevent-host-death family protein
MKLGLREANQHFSKAIKAVRAGKEVVLTERGQPIAVIKPIKAEQELEEDTVLKRMADEGLITLPSRKGPLPRVTPIRINGKPLSQTIVEDRDDRV